MMKYGRFAVLVLMAVVSGCQAGWLAGSRSGIVINAGGDMAGTTGRLARIEEQLGDLTAEVNVQTRGLSWTAQGASRDWRSVAVSADGLMQMKGGASDPIYLSNDGGMTWSAAGVTKEWLTMAMSGDGRYRSASAWDPDTDAQRYFSTNSGATWTNIGQPWALAALSGNGRYQVAAEEFGVLHVSTNYGAAWVATKTDEVRHWMGLAMSTNGEYQTAVSSPEDEMSSGVYVSSDYGNTWILNMAGPQWMSVAMSADGRIQLVCALGGKLYGSENHGATWTAKTGSNRAWWFVAMSADGKMQYAAERGGAIYVSGDYGVTWADSGSARCPWTGLAVSADGGFGLAAVNGGPCQGTRPATSLRGDLTVSGSLTLGAGGTITVTNAVDGVARASNAVHASKLAGLVISNSAIAVDVAELANSRIANNDVRYLASITNAVSTTNAFGLVTVSNGVVAIGTNTTGLGGGGVTEHGALTGINADTNHMHVTSNELSRIPASYTNTCVQGSYRHNGTNSYWAPVYENYNGGLVTVWTHYTNMPCTRTTNTWIVPAGVPAVLVKAWGGGGAGKNSPGGSGGFAQTILYVSPGDTVTVLVAAGGSTNNAVAEQALTAGWPNGGLGSVMTNGGAAGGGGGGSSIIEHNGALALIAAGGGGGSSAAGTVGGAGGGAIGQDGVRIGGTSSAGGGSQEAGGVGGVATQNGESGAFLRGGNACLTINALNGRGGGGGGGYYGGGGGGDGNSQNLSGGGGSSFFRTSDASGYYVRGNQTDDPDYQAPWAAAGALNNRGGDGMVLLKWYYTIP